MSVFHKTMVWLGLVDDDEYYGDDEEFEACLDLVEAGCRGLASHMAELLRDEGAA